MSATQVIEEIKHLSPAEQAEVIRFAFQLAHKRQLTGEELGELANRMVEAKDPAVASQLREEIVRGFYGGEPHAWSSPHSIARSVAPASFAASA